VIGIIGAASIIMGLILGCWITMIIMAAEISFSQERMQRKVRRAHVETARVRFTADQFTDEAAVIESLPPERADWPQAS
jgi:hypothetical protein